MKKLNKLSIILLFPLLWSCAKKEKVYYFQEENGIEFNEQLKLVETDTISFPLDHTTTFDHYSIQITKNDEDSCHYLSFFNHIDKSITYYNFSDRKAHKIFLEEEGKNGLGTLTVTTAHFFISPSNIYIYNPWKRMLFEIDENGAIKEKHKAVDPFSAKDTPFPEPSTADPFIIDKGKVYFTCGLSKPQKNYTHYGMVMVYDLTTKESKFIIPLPDEYNDVFWGTQFKYMANFTYNPTKKNLVVNYPVSPFLYEYSLEGKKLDSTYVGSKFIEVIKPMTYDINDALKKNRDWEKEKMYSKSTSDYSKVMYDAKNNLYYRIVYIRPSEEDVKSGNGVLNFSVIITDDKFQKLGEQKFSSKTHTNSMILVSDLGLMIARRDLYNKDEDKMTFSIFNVSEITNP